ncbi:hypothetical protein [Salinicoccus sp. HZC-1]|uniref:hypothetical protein n=1 Tax=Salinicoccus sp. HZC-1 TaxID=3385497 RepID=UPI00398B6098
MYFINGKFNQTFRDYDVYKKLGIVSVTGKSNESAIGAIDIGDVFALYSTRYGYLGVGKVVEAAKPFEEIEMHQGGLLIDHEDYPFKEIRRINPHFGKEEYALRVEWLALVPELEDGIVDDDLFVGRRPVELLEDVRTKKWLMENFDLNIRI